MNSPTVRVAVKSQAHLGWDQLYQGQLSQHWAQAINAMHPNIQASDTQIMTNFTQNVWNYVLDTWKLHNQHLHHDAGQLSTPNYQQTIQTMYKLQHQLPLAAQEAIFNRPLEQILDQPPETLCTWLTQTN